MRGASGPPGPCVRQGSSSASAGTARPRRWGADAALAPSRVPAQSSTRPPRLRRTVRAWVWSGPGIVGAALEGQLSISGPGGSGRGRQRGRGVDTLAVHRAAPPVQFRQKVQSMASGTLRPPPRTVRGAGARSRLPRRPYGLRHGRHAVAGPRPSPGLHRPARILPSPARVLNMAAAPSACSHGSPAHQAPLPAKRPAPHPRPARVGAGRTSRRVRRARACSPPVPRAAPSPCRPLPRDQTPAHSRRCLRAASLPLPTAPRPPRGSRCTSEC